MQRYALIGSELPWSQILRLSMLLDDASKSVQKFIILHCTGHIMMGSFTVQKNQFRQLVKILHCQLVTIEKQLATFPHRIWVLNHRLQEVVGKCVTNLLWPYIPTLILYSILLIV